MKTAAPLRRGRSRGRGVLLGLRYTKQDVSTIRFKEFCGHCQDEADAFSDIIELAECHLLNLG